MTLAQIENNKASATFLAEGEQQLFNVSDPVRFTKLREKIDRVKSGQDVIHEPVQDWDAFIENL